jgi:acyl carrier protein
MTPKLEDLVRQQFPGSKFEDGADLAVGSFPEWNSLAHFNLLLLIEEAYGIHFGVDDMSDMKSLRDIRNRLSAAGITA